MQTAQEVLARIEAAGTAAQQDVRVCRSVQVGKCPAHQGDVYLHRVAADHPRGAKLGTRQVAVGTTVGSRHVVEGDGVEVYAGVKLPGAVKPWPDVPESAYLGPVVVAPEGLTLTHPEHAHHRLPSGCYQVTYQVDPVAQRRVQD